MDARETAREVIKLLKSIPYSEFEERLVLLLESASRLICCWCKHPSSLELTWSDREACCCIEHIPEAVVAVALDHYYDREQLRIGIDVSSNGDDCGLFAAAASWLDSNRPDWHDKTISFDDDDCRVGLLTALRTLLAARRQI